MKKKVLILGNSHLVVFKFRGELIEELVQHNYDVYVCFPKWTIWRGKGSCKKIWLSFYRNSNGTQEHKSCKGFENYKELFFNHKKKRVQI